MGTFLVDFFRRTFLVAVLRSVSKYETFSFIITFLKQLINDLYF